MDFEKMLKQQLKETSNTETLTRKNDMVELKKNKDAHVRIVPLGPDKWFANQYRQVFVTLHRKDNTDFSTFLFFSADDDKEDKLLNLVKAIVEFNSKMSAKYKKANDKIFPDAVKLNNGKYNARIQQRYEMVAINLLGKDFDQETANGRPVFRNLSVSRSVYNSLLTAMATYSMGRGKKFPTPLGLVDKDYSFPIEISFDQSAVNYDVSVRADMLIEESLPDDYLDVDEDGNYLYIDDPYKFTQPTKDADSDFYERAYKELKERFETESKAYVKAMSEGNPYVSDGFNGNVNAEKDDEISIKDEDLPFSDTTKEPKEPTDSVDEDPFEKKDTSSDDTVSDTKQEDADGSVSTKDIENMTPEQLLKSLDL